MKVSVLFILGLEFFETSAKDNINVKQAFDRLVDMICKKMDEQIDGEIADANKGKTCVKMKFSDEHFLVNVSLSA